MTYQDLPRPFFVLAPMDDVTDTVFRQTVASLPCPPQADGVQGAGEQRTEPYMKYGEGAVEPATQQSAARAGRVTGPASKQASSVRGYGSAPDLFFTEFTNVDGLQSPGRPRLLKKLKFVESETRLVAHIWGLKPENFYKTAQQIADGTFAHELGLPEGSNFVGIDLNMGCPAKSEVKAGACSALINDRPLAQEIIQATQAGAAAGSAGQQMPVSVKTRLGFSSVDLTWPEFLLQQNLAMLTMHCRTRKEMSKVPAHWDYLADLVKLRDQLAPNTLIVANGDIADRRHGLALAEQYGVDGLMIGRGIFHNPYAFAEQNPWSNLSKQARLALYKKQVELFAQTWQAGERNIKTLNKFCKIYVNGFDGAKELRERLMAANSCDELLALLA